MNDDQKSDFEWLQLAAYLHGDASADERARVEQWLDADPSRRRELDRLRTAWAALPSAPIPQFDVRGIWSEVAASTGVRAVPALNAATTTDQPLQDREARVSVSARTSRAVRNARTRFLPQRVWSPVAAFVFVVVVAVIGWGAGARHRTGLAAQSALTYTTAKGERANITLPDGNTVALNIASRLEVPANYVAGDHTLRLSGEALFTVTHHDRVPVTVMVAGKPVARVLGTSFAVRQYPGEPTVSVAVREGRVNVRSTIVAAGQEAIVGPGAEVRIRQANAAQFSFATGVITLDGMPLTEAIPQLNRWYDADIRLGDSSLAQQRIGGSFVAGSLTDLQRVLELTFNVRVVRNGRALTLFPR